MSNIMDYAGAIFVLLVGLVLIGWFLRQVLCTQVPMDTTPPDTGVPGELPSYDRLRVRAWNRLLRVSRY